ncbi:MAG: hypothetical protein ABR874_16735 [Candidatus Sulfotelmatobacter sp.]|jgi:hypothetical protein
MARGMGWRLLAAFLLILVASISRGQNPPEERWQPIDLPSVSPPYLRFTGPIRLPGAPERYSPSPPIFNAPSVVRSAGIIFSGRVISVGRSGAFLAQDAASTVITFQVEHAIRGATTGQNLTIREWAGLWDRGERYRVGERVLLFLYPVSKLGFTSPVAGPMGRFAIDGQDRIAMNPYNSAIFARDPLIGGRTVVPYIEFAGAVQRGGAQD